MMAVLRGRNLFADRNAVVFMVAAAVVGFAALFGSHPSVIWLALLCAGLTVVVLFRHPLLGLVATIVTALFVPFALGTGREVSLNLSTVAVPGTFGLWMLIMVRQRNLHLPRSSTTPPLLLFLLASLLSLVVGNAFWDPAIPRPGNLVLVQLGQWGIFAFSALAFWLMASMVRDETWLRRLTFLFLALGGILAAVRVLPDTASFRAMFATYAVDRAPFWLLLAALGGGQLLFNPSLSRRWRWLLWAVMGLVMAFAFVVERTTLSNLAGVLPALGVLTWLRWPRWRWGFVAIGLVAVTIFASAIFEFAGGDDEWDESGGSRLTLIQRVVDVTMRNPVTGLGPASYRAYARMQPLAYGRAFYLEPHVNSHNNYVDLFAHTGLLGLTIFAWFSVEVFRLGLQMRQRFSAGFAGGYANAMLALWVGALVLMLFADWILPHVYNIGFPGFQASVLVWLFLGGLVTLEHIPPSDERELRTNES